MILRIYNEFINVDVVKEKRFKQIQEFIDGRAVKNKEYFDKNECIKTAGGTHGKDYLKQPG